MVPEGWEKKTFGCVTRIANGQVDPNDEPYLSMPHIGPENVVSNSGQLIKVKNCKELGLISGKYEFDENAIVYSKIRPNLNKVCKPSFKGVCSADMYPIWGVPEQLNSDYLLHYMLGPSFCKVAVAMSMRTGMPKINRNDLNAIKVLLPPLPEQKKIAQILSTWDKAIKTTEQLLANSQQQKKALMQQLLTGKKRLLDENGERFSGGWKDTALSEIGRIVSGGTPDTKNEDYWGGSVSWLTPTDVTALKSRYVEATSRTITEKGLKKSSATLLPPRSLMVCTRATVGAAAISTSEITTNQGFKSLIPSKQFDVEFIYYLVAHFNKKLTRKASGSTFLELSKRDFEKTSFNCPSLHEQKKISKTLSSADDEIEVLNTKLERLNREKKALMQQLLTGKRRVKFDDNAGDKTSYSF